MRLIRQPDCPTPVTTAAPTFIQLLYDALPRHGWIILNLTAFSLFAKNRDGKVIHVVDADRRAYLTGYRSEDDPKGFPSESQLMVDGHHAVVGSRATITPTSWWLFVSPTSFYFINNGELLGFGHFTPLFDDDETYFVVGSRAAFVGQSVLVAPNQPSSMLFLEGSGVGLDFGRLAGLSVFQRIDDYDFAQVNNTQLITASPVAVHHPESKQLRGFLPDLFAFNSSFSHEGYLYSLGGYQLYCIVIQQRCMGVVLDA